VAATLARPNDEANNVESNKVQRRFMVSSGTVSLLNFARRA
jgi:hypothetical protein